MLEYFEWGDTSPSKSICMFPKLICAEVGK